MGSMYLLTERTCRSADYSVRIRDAPRFSCGASILTIGHEMHCSPITRIFNGPRPQPEVASSIIINKKPFAVGSVTLLLGALFYILARPPEQTYFLSKIGLADNLSNFWGNNFIPLGHNLPSFIHVFSFILLTAGFIHYSKKRYLLICLFWLLIDIVFELGQKFNPSYLKVIPNCLFKLPILENTYTFFCNGTFDSLDLLAVIFGALAACLFLLSTIPGGWINEKA